ncbi:MAG: hypothetical protein AAFP19_27270, partial [Bacteroidota bacterium]
CPSKSRTSRGLSGRCHSKTSRPFDGQGRIVEELREFRMDQELILDYTDLSAGLYWVLLKWPDGSKEYLRWLRL